MSFRLATISDRATLVDDDGGLHDLARLLGDERLADPMVAVGERATLHSAGGRLSERSADGTLDEALAAGRVGAPVPRPRNVLAVGLNYREHAEESGMDLPETPLVFTKFPSCIVGPVTDLELRSETADWEVELVVAIGRTARDVSADSAWDHVLGLTVGQDISDRRLQFAAKPPHFDLGKSRDGYGPTGPVLVSPDLVPDPSDLALSCAVNGVVKQDSRTSDLIFDVGELIAYLSAIMTLRAGDLIFTGTPSGVGSSTRTYLRPGDEVVSEIEGIGRIVQRCC